MDAYNWGVNHRSSLAIASVFLSAVALGQRVPADAPALAQAVRKARTQSISVRPKPPKWMDFERVQAGYAFLGKHGKMAGQIMGTSSLAATFAAKDIAPVLMETGRLPKDFQQRMRETGEWMDTIFDPPKDSEDFTNREYTRAVELGQMHADVASLVRPKLHWNARERVPMNEQAFAFVLYTFVWQPVEAMIATKEVDPVRDAKELDGWFHLWSVLGYGMGVNEALLPKNFEQAVKTVALLRKAQYASPGESLPEGIPILLGGHVNMIAAKLAEKSKGDPRKMAPAAAIALAGVFALSPGLTEALGLQHDAVARLTEYAGIPVGK